jgi:hypothetical protein
MHIAGHLQDAPDGIVPGRFERHSNRNPQVAFALLNARVPPDQLRVVRCGVPRTPWVV